MNGKVETSFVEPTYGTDTVSFLRGLLLLPFLIKFNQRVTAEAINSLRLIEKK